MSASLVQLAERGDAYLAQSDSRWRALAADQEFWRLVEGGILRVSQPSRDAVVLTASKYAGRAIVSGVVLEVTAKVPGALGALLGYASGDAFRLEELQAPETELGPLASLLVTQFVNAVRRYASAGRDFHYVALREVASLVGGRLDMTGTIRLRARGMRHLVAFQRQTVAHDTLKNRLIRAALREVQVLSGAIPVRDADVAEARGLAMLFDDCVDREVMFGRRTALADSAEALRRSSATPAERDLLGLVGVMLSRASFELEAPGASSVPRAWFIDLESLFESAVLRVLEAAVRTPFEVLHGSLIRPPVFSGGAAAYTANPDIVVRKESQVLAVGDVKYKYWCGRADAADIYQLLVHASAFETGRCFLVYPHDRLELIALGRSSTGAEVWLVGVDLLNMEEGIMTVLDALGVGAVTKTALGRHRPH